MPTPNPEICTTTDYADYSSACSAAASTTAPTGYKLLTAIIQWCKDTLRYILTVIFVYLGN